MTPTKIKIISYKYPEVWYNKAIGEYLIVDSDSLNDEKINPTDIENHSKLLSVVKIIEPSAEDYLITVWNRKFPTKKQKKEFYREAFKIYISDTNYNQVIRKLKLQKIENEKR